MPRAERCLTYVVDGRPPFRTLPVAHATNGETMHQDNFQSRLALARGGCDRTASEIVESFRKYLLLVANHRLPAEVRQKEGASDLVQNTIVEACNGIAKFVGSTPEEFQVWIRQILVHNVADAQRRYQISEKRQVSRELSLDRDVSTANVRNEQASKEPTPSKAASRAEEARLLEALLKRLPLDYQQVLRLRNESALTFDDIGMEMDRSGEAVRKLWTRAIERLKKEMEKGNGRS
ncbi:MAG: sigma-70 family RNA polymerase sigma factor [Pirellulales bacterium]